MDRRYGCSRAQEALARPGEHITALRELLGRFLTQGHFFRTIAEEITDVDICYQMGNDRSDQHPLVGMWGPNLTLHAERGTTRIAELMGTGRGLLVDLADRSTLHDVVSKWSDRVERILGCCYERPANLDAILIRPDGYVAWVLTSGEGDKESEISLGAAFR